jgi:hypothetical protein
LIVGGAQARPTNKNGSVTLPFFKKSDESDQLRLPLLLLALLPAPPTDDARELVKPLPLKPLNPPAKPPAGLADALAFAFALLLGLPPAAVAAVRLVRSAPLAMAVATKALRSPPKAASEFTTAAAS